MYSPPPQTHGATSFTYDVLSYLVVHQLLLSVAATTESKEGLEVVQSLLVPSGTEHKTQSKKMRSQKTGAHS